MTAVKQHQYVYPRFRKASQIGLSLFSSIKPHDVHRVVKRLPVENYFIEKKAIIQIFTHRAFQ